MDIQCFIEAKTKSNCRVIGFSLPNDLLAKYDMLWSKNKFDAQPKPTKQIMQNINFAVGLINSDGYLSLSKRKFEKFVLTGTVESIIDSFTYSLAHNDIFYREYTYKAKIDKRTGHIGKDIITVNIAKKKSIERFRKITKFKLRV